jgi:hypothetical protein
MHRSATELQRQKRRRNGVYSVDASGSTESQGEVTVRFAKNSGRVVNGVEQTR